MEDKKKHVAETTLRSHYEAPRTVKRHRPGGWDCPHPQTVFGLVKV